MTGQSIHTRSYTYVVRAMTVLSEYEYVRDTHALAPPLRLARIPRPSDVDACPVVNC